MQKIERERAMIMCLLTVLEKFLCANSKFIYSNFPYNNSHHMSHPSTFPSSPGCSLLFVHDGAASNTIRLCEISY